MSARRVSWNVDDPAYSSKAKRMKELVEMAREDGRKIIVFSFFLETIRSVCAILGESCTAPIDGSTPVQKRQEIIDEFGNKPEKTVLPAQIQSGGTGLNIQAASVVILCEPQLKPSIELQAISRAYRMGQARNVLVYRLLCEVRSTSASWRCLRKNRPFSTLLLILRSPRPPRRARRWQSMIRRWERLLSLKSPVSTPNAPLEEHKRRK